MGIKKRKTGWNGYIETEETLNNDKHSRCTIKSIISSTISEETLWAEPSTCPGRGRG